MKRPTHQTFKKAAFKLPGVLEGYEALEDEFTLIGELMSARKRAGQSQKNVAKLMQTTASAISRLEAGNGQRHHSPSLSTLRRYAKAVGCHLSIKLIPDTK